MANSAERPKSKCAARMDSDQMPFWRRFTRRAPNSGSRTRRGRSTPRSPPRISIGIQRISKTFKVHPTRGTTGWAPRIRRMRVKGRRSRYWRQKTGPTSSHGNRRCRVSNPETRWSLFTRLIWENSLRPTFAIHRSYAQISRPTVPVSATTTWASCSCHRKKVQWIPATTGSPHSTTRLAAITTRGKYTRRWITWGKSAALWSMIPKDRAQKMLSATALNIRNRFISKATRTSNAERSRKWLHRTIPFKPTLASPMTGWWDMSNLRCWGRIQLVQPATNIWAQRRATSPQPLPLGSPLRTMAVTKRITTRCFRALTRVGTTLNYRTSKIWIGILIIKRSKRLRLAWWNRWTKPNRMATFTTTSIRTNA